ncbi:hypothetical protein GJ496_002015 [Pomphorhynchus laevis]|nr:hypothetical protein GJ496_005792 [Pomphorhynchus laevis]KAI0990426.1 hypothetical protein GJ496_002012 [Pomphorhynchus laevis]KAI0990430.1 hypothetical protein GJ496_002015 [Pomphorhynchus laevis]
MQTIRIFVKILYCAWVRQPARKFERMQSSVMWTLAKGNGKISVFQIPVMRAFPKYVNIPKVNCVHCAHSMDRTNAQIKTKLGETHHTSSHKCSSFAKYVDWANLQNKNATIGKRFAEVAKNSNSTGQNRT